MDDRYPVNRDSFSLVADGRQSSQTLGLGTRLAVCYGELSIIITTDRNMKLARE